MMINYFELINGGEMCLDAEIIDYLKAWGFVSNIDPHKRGNCREGWQKVYRTGNSLHDTWVTIIGCKVFVYTEDCYESEVNKLDFKVDVSTFEKFKKDISRIYQEIF